MNPTYRPSKMLVVGEKLAEGEYLRSPNGRFTGVLETGGNFVLRWRINPQNSQSIPYLPGPRRPSHGYRSNLGYGALSSIIGADSNSTGNRILSATSSANLRPKIRIPIV